ncbi:hypothetical protein NPIL_280751 [Nephila pilipes]|uniref:Uncharacterized protein n=1 Tax=Nephila pilipes TaxID=299642 RepID=A0A8X6MCP9_NEPPI|nr:hypothetical protein NPIL_280751 [Nephila pilipes]
MTLKDDIIAFKGKQITTRCPGRCPSALQKRAIQPLPQEKCPPPPRRPSSFGVELENSATFFEKRRNGPESISRGKGLMGPTRGPSFDGEGPERVPHLLLGG